ncbi:hypothetical protein BDR04DRAFT_1119866 [Suillus decipiens]|nr:hypothetical protein BDR04DRAFT_1119866 [Suillus decipiens]
MTGTVLTNGKDEPHVVCPVCKIKPTTALLQHLEKAALSSQTKAINNFCAAEASKHASEVSQPAALTVPVVPQLGPWNTTTKTVYNGAKDTKWQPQEPQATQVPINKTPGINRTPANQQTWPQQTLQTHQLHPSQQE